MIVSGPADAGCKRSASTPLPGPSLHRSRPRRCIAMTRRCGPSLCSFLPKTKAKCRLPRRIANHHHRIANDHLVALSHGLASKQPPGNSSPCRRCRLGPSRSVALTHHTPHATAQQQQQQQPPHPCIEIRASHPCLPKTINTSPPPPPLLPTIPLIRRRRIPRPTRPTHPSSPTSRPRRSRRSQRGWAMRTVLLKPELDGAVVLAENHAGGVFGEVLLAHVRVDGDVEFAGVEVGVLVVAHCARGLPGGLLGGVGVLWFGLVRSGRIGRSHPKRWRTGVACGAVLSSSRSARFLKPWVADQSATKLLVVLVIDVVIINDSGDDLVLRTYATRVLHRCVVCCCEAHLCLQTRKLHQTRNAMHQTLSGLPLFLQQTHSSLTPANSLLCAKGVVANGISAIFVDHSHSVTNRTCLPQPISY